MIRFSAYQYVAIGLALCTILGTRRPLVAQEDSDQPVTREEFSRFLEEYQKFQAEHSQLKTENDKLKSELDKIKAEVAELKGRGDHADFEAAFETERAAVLKEVREELGRRTQPLMPGLANITFGGFASTRAESRRGSDSTFGANLAPILLWKPTDKLLFETRFDIFLAEDETEVDLAYAQLSYLFNDHLTLGAGKFVMPFGIFWERARAPWINKLPTMPLLYESNFMGEAGLGFQLRGGAPIGKTKINYAFYVINGPEFRTNPSDQGRLGFGRSLDNNNNKAVGGRFGFLPIPELEIGASALVGRVGTSGTRHGRADTTILGVDFSYGREFDAIKGRLDLRGEFVRVDSDDVDFGGLFNLYSFDNKRNGWYFQVAYRPTKSEATFLNGLELKDLEFVMRYDQVHEPGRDGLGIDRDQLSLGLDYWILPSVVLKAAYVFENARGGEDEDGFFLEVAAGF